MVLTLIIQSSFLPCIVPRYNAFDAKQKMMKRLSVTNRQTHGQTDLVLKLILEIAWQCIGQSNHLKFHGIASFEFNLVSYLVCTIHKLKANNLFFRYKLAVPNSRNSQIRGQKSCPIPLNSWSRMSKLAGLALTCTSCCKGQTHIVEYSLIKALGQVISTAMKF